MNKEEAFTGLEAAIVLIAFVVVAAVFSYVVLGAGFFTTQKSQEVVYSSVEQASSSIEILGDVYGLADDPASDINTLQFTLGLTSGGTAVDFDKVVMTYSTATYGPTILNGSLNDMVAGGWNITNVSNRVELPSNPDKLLESNEQFVINATLPSDHNLEENEDFNLEIKPSVGTALAIKRTGPNKIYNVNVLY